MSKKETKDETQDSEPKQYEVWHQNWLESEAGWGIRPDGHSLHLTKEDLEKYIERYWDSMPASAPHEYSRPMGPPYLTKVPQKIYDEIKETKYGNRYWR